MIDNLLLGVATAFSLHNLLYALFGVFVGNVIGVLPGIGALAAISMLLPITYGMDATGAVMMLAGIYYGTSFGGATTAILLNLPGTVSHAVVCVDGNPMAKQGRGGSALFMAMFASFLGVLTGIVLMMLLGPVLAEAAFLFGPTEYFALMLLGLFAASTLTSGAPLKGIAAVVIGLIFGVVGTDVNSGVARYAFGIPELQDGVSLIALAMALFGIADVLTHAGRLGEGTFVANAKIKGGSVRPAKGEIRQSMPSIARGSVAGSFFGILPGTGGSLAAFLSYAMEKKISKTPERFGRGAVEGVAGPEAANSAGAITAFIPTLTLGIPGDAIMALMLGALMIHNIAPGPQLMVEHPDLFWGLLVSFGIGNLMLMVLNIPLIGMWVKLLSVPYRFIFPTVLFLICIGVYSANNNLFDVWVVLGLGLLGFAFARLGIPPAPLLLAFVLGPLVEENFRRALLLSRGDMMVFVSRPISATCVAVIVLMLAWVMYKNIRRRPLVQIA